MSDRLVIAGLYPAGFDIEAIRARVADCGREVDVRFAFYEDGQGVRTRKAKEPDRAVWREISPPVTDQVKAVLVDAEIALGLDLPFEVETWATKLRWVQTYGAGTDQYDHHGLRAAGVRVTNSAGVGAPPIAEFVIARVLEIYKRTREIEQQQRDHVWKFAVGRLLMGATMGVVGLGAIGSETAKRARALGLRVIASRRSYQPGMTHEHADELVGPGGADLAHLLGSSDIVVLSAPHTSETESLIGERELAQMKSGSILVNVGRGALVDESALIAALESGHLGAAILDVQRHEPLPEDDALWGAPNCYLSPHSSTSPDGYNERWYDLFSRNLRRYLADEALINLV